MEDVHTLLDGFSTGFCGCSWIPETLNPTRPRHPVRQTVLPIFQNERNRARALGAEVVEDPPRFLDTLDTLDTLNTRATPRRAPVIMRVSANIAVAA